MEANYEAVMTLPEPESPLAAELHYYRGRRALREGRLDEATFFMAEATAAATHRVDYHKQYAELLFEVGEVYHANDVWKRVLELDETATEALYHLASNCAYISQYEEAAAYASEYLARETRGQYTEAVQSLLELIELEQEFEDDEEDELISWHSEAQRQIDKGRLFAAKGTLERLIEHYPEFWPGYNNLAIVNFYLGNDEAAFQTLEYVLDENPGNLHALLNTILLLHEAGQSEAALQLSSPLTRVRPLQFDLRYKLATTLALVGQYDRAYEELRLLKERGFHGDSLFGHWLSVSAYKTGRLEEAASYLNSEEMKQIEDKQAFDIRENLEFRSALVQGLRQEDDVARVEIIRIISNLADDEAFEALALTNKVTENETVRAFAEKCRAVLCDQPFTGDVKIHRAYEALLLAEEQVSEAERMSLEGDFYERFAKLLLSQEGFEDVSASAAALVWMFYAKRDALILEDCAQAFMVPVETLTETIRAFKRTLEQA
ncbi:hypothetical protein [Exiguobacterium algae]|uniref:hypothetical protein n=1 Tax=Exiguobacterium algae TaxID=2751250 RepID=UPI001BE5DE0B|nr:hypothetical protein [Exiguobacterium algae]